MCGLAEKGLKQWFLSLITHWDQLGSFKNYSYLVAPPEVLISLVWGAD